MCVTDHELVRIITSAQVFSKELYRNFLQLKGFMVQLWDVDIIPILKEASGQSILLDTFNIEHDIKSLYIDVIYAFEEYPIRYTSCSAKSTCPRLSIANNFEPNSDYQLYGIKEYTAVVIDDLKPNSYPCQIYNAVKITEDIDSVIKDITRRIPNIYNQVLKFITNVNRAYTISGLKPSDDQINYINSLDDRLHGGEIRTLSTLGDDSIPRLVMYNLGNLDTEINLSINSIKDISTQLCSYPDASESGSHGYRP